MTDVPQPEWMKGFQPQPWEGKWKPGQSGNPAGKPKGITDKRSKLMRQIAEDAGDVLKAVLEKAKAGDPASAALVLSRVLPTLRAQSETVEFDFDPSLPIGRQVEQVLAAIAGGAVAPDVGKMIIDAISALSNVRATEELAERLAILEAKAVN